MKTAMMVSLDSDRTKVEVKSSQAGARVSFLTASKLVLKVTTDNILKML